ncbi:ATP-dependent Clp protease proteolytic subunit-like isoform X1 [Schistocerca gregaria]|uniref:ATP-dependent Clp protease proteolytic subunit-like isoform X1 n=1 Tax=Schistocerca gregaria TaxID=7010 RepID=UPI00211E2B2C|nr:ATP-dependent Clp protease proteolytic subunit-like isoform X1 [Schistocerca gregaria]
MLIGSTRFVKKLGVSQKKGEGRIQYAQRRDVAVGGKASGQSWYPTWYERDIENFRGIDLISRLLKDRIVFIDGPINNASASITVSQLLLLEAEDPSSQISLYINSPGGEVHAGLAIYDTMQYIQSPIVTICIGQACSMASLLLTAGTPGMRRALPHSYIMVHQPSSGTQGQASDIEIHAKHILSLKLLINSLYEKHTGMSLEQIERALDRDTWLTASEARSWNLIDQVVDKRKPEPKINEDLPKSGSQVATDTLPGGLSDQRPSS